MLHVEERVIGQDKNPINSLFHIIQESTNSAEPSNLVSTVQTMSINDLYIDFYNDILTGVLL